MTLYHWEKSYAPILLLVLAAVVVLGVWRVVRWVLSWL
jgi:hypothetical protein